MILHEVHIIQYQPLKLQPTRQHPPYAQLLFKSGRCCHAEFFLFALMDIASFFPCEIWYNVDSAFLFLRLTFVNYVCFIISVLILLSRRQAESRQQLKLGGLIWHVHVHEKRLEFLLWLNSCTALLNNPAPLRNVASDYRFHQANKLFVGFLITFTAFFFINFVFSLDNICFCFNGNTDSVFQVYQLPNMRYLCIYIG